MNTLPNCPEHMEPLLEEAQKHFDVYEITCPENYREKEEHRRRNIQARLKTTSVPDDAAKAALWRAILPIDPGQLMLPDYDFLFGHLWLIPDEMGTLVFVDPVFSTDFSTQFAKLFERGIVDESFFTALQDFLVLADAYTVILYYQVWWFVSELLHSQDSNESKIFLDRLLGSSDLSSYSELREELESIRGHFLVILQQEQEILQEETEESEAVEDQTGMTLVEAFQQLNEGRDHLRKKPDLIFYQNDVSAGLLNPLLNLPEEYLPEEIRSYLSEMSVRLQVVDDSSLQDFLEEMDKNQKLTRFFCKMNTRHPQNDLFPALFERGELDVGLMIDECLERKLVRENRRQGWVDLS